MSKADADAAYRKVREICLRFPAAEEKLSHGMPSFHVRGKMFAHFIDNHHRGPVAIAVWCKSSFENQKRLVAENPSRFFVPPYVGVKGWLGIDVDPRRADFIELAMLVEEAWMAIAPSKLVSGEVKAPKAGKKAPLTRVSTDEKIAKVALAKLTAICAALPNVEEDRDLRHATFRIRKKVFAYFLDNHHGDGIVSVCVKGDARKNAKLVASDPKRFYIPAYIGARGYVGIRLDGQRVDWKDVATRVKESWELTSLLALTGVAPAVQAAAIVRRSAR